MAKILASRGGPGRASVHRVLMERDALVQGVTAPDPGSAANQF